MPAIVFYFQIHQPFRLRPYTVFDIGTNHMYEDLENNRSIMLRVAEKSYLPMNELLFELIKKYNNKFKISFSISGTALDQFVDYVPELIESFSRLAKTGCVEFFSETYSHSLSFLYSRREFESQVIQHRKRLEELFGVNPVTFRNTELIYNNDLAKAVEDMGYKIILAEGADHLLGFRSPNYIYQPVSCDNLRLLLRNHRLSDDIAFRFSDRTWTCYPLTAEKYAAWIHNLEDTAEIVNIFMDYETFGEHNGEESGIFDFMRALPGAILAKKGFVFMTASEATKKQVAGKIDAPQYVSWADAERNLTAWLGNDMQLDAIESLYRLEEKVHLAANPDLLRVWQRLQSSDHFYYMSTKWLSDGEVHSSFNPYASPYDAYINFMNIADDFEKTLDLALENKSQQIIPTKNAYKKPARTEKKLSMIKNSTKIQDKAKTKTPGTKKSVKKTAQGKA